MEIDFNVVVLVLGSMITVLGGAIGLKLVSNQHKTPEYQQEKMKNLMEDYNDLKKENHYLRGKVAQVRQKFKIDDEFDLDNDGDLVSLAKSVLPSILDFLPKDVQDKAKGLLTNPDMIELFAEIYKKHPEQIKGLLGGFLKKGPATTSSNEGQSQTSQLQDAGGA